MNKGMYSSLRGDWETPPEIFDPLNERFHFQLDVCATPENAKCDRFYTPDDNGLAQRWSDYDYCWMNPPYGRQIGKWVAKAHDESEWGATVVCLLPARTDTAWWHDHCTKADEIWFLKGRIYFMVDGALSDRAPFPSAIVIFRGLDNTPAVRWLDWGKR